MILKTVFGLAISLLLLGCNALLALSQVAKPVANNNPNAVVPSGFTETAITGLSNPTAMAIHPDGRIFVCQQTGELRVIKNGVVLPTPFVTLAVNSVGERGLLGVAFDPNYATNRFVYVYYTATTPAIHNRVSRFTANSANEDVAVAGSEFVLLDLENLSFSNHNGGAIHFGPDGKLYIATGENAITSNSQSLANRLGKILRINSNGTIPNDNPTSFPNIAGSPTGVNRAIWAVGLRNPFTFSFQPGTGRMHINDVGAGTWEEINVGAPGLNFGWPNCEGACGAAGMTNPIYQYSSAESATCAITGGAFYNPTNPTFPSEYIGKYFFADFCAGWIKTIDPLNPPATGTAPNVFTAIGLPVDIQVANDGSLYYLARQGGTVFRVQYNGEPALAINDLTIVEGNAGTSVATFNVLLSAVSSQTVTVNYTTANNSASAGSDYVATSGTLTFAPGQTSKTISVTINGDTTLEPDETFNVNLSSAANASIADNQGLGTILDDDALMLATEENSQRAIALDSLFFVRDPIPLTSVDFLGNERQGSVTLFAINLTLTPGIVVTAEAVDAQQVTHQLPVEFVGSLPAFAGFTQLNLKLPEGITVAGDLRVTITVNGQTSNVVLIAVKP